VTETELDGDEEVGEDEDRGDREEDLLNDEGADQPGEGGRGDHRRQHDEHHDRPEVRREDAVQRDADSVGAQITRNRISPG
jgi:hypothetical protein